MIKKIALNLIFLSFTSTIWSCGDGVPEGVIGPEKMTEVIMDVYIGEGKISALNIKRDSALTLYAVYEQKLFEKHNISREVYRESLSYYYENPDMLDVVYDGVLDSLNHKDQLQRKALELERSGTSEEDNDNDNNEQEREIDK